jgi:hypothetical protein
MIKDIVQKIRPRNVIAITFAISLALVVGGLLWSYFALQGGATPLIIHFNDRVGINQFGGMRELIGIGSFGIIAVLVDFILAFALIERDKVLAYILAIGGLFVSALIFITFSVIISVN